MDTPKPPPDTPVSENYGAEVLCANWNPVVGAVADSKGAMYRDLTVDLAAGEAESFLDQFYRCQGS